MLKLDDLMAGNKMYSNNHKGFAHFLKSRSMASLPSCSTEKLSLATHVYNLHFSLFTIGFELFIGNFSPRRIQPLADRDG